ncbi:MFS transporter [Aetokthonos hydrillicola Thurmond2011]|uniref:MFS transporter n=1 Tax=Aetokthonos hydrillicola Thurmond2011 TaxID=2712845 RepID=A0AAP5I4I3_9CYAN|nr:MFS transporter [Aetokthonos hydrillicola]MDR9892978.1 MFS transporter [Aetokthonos hydrillicola Thurmond2011]
MIFALSHLLWLSLVSLAIAGFGFIMQITSGRTVVQLLVTDENRGQITSLYVMTTTGAVPIGNLVAGALASNIGAVNTVIFGASICIVGSLIFMQQLSAFHDLVRLNLDARGFKLK